MSDADVIRIGTTALVLAFKLGAPMLLAALLLGLVISLIQAVFQVQDQTLTFVPKLAACAAVLILTGPWMYDSLVTYTAELWQAIPELIRST